MPLTSAQPHPRPPLHPWRREGSGAQGRLWCTGACSTLAVNTPFPRPCPSTLPRNKMLFYFMEVTLSSSQTSRGEAVLFYGPALNATA